MAVAETAGHFVANHAESRVRGNKNIFLGYGSPETRPARPGFEFRVGKKKRIAATNAAIKSLGVIVHVGVVEGTLGSCVARDLVLLGLEQLAPLLVGLYYLW